MFRKKKDKKEKKETLAHKIIMTIVSAGVTATAAGLVGYYLNTKLPELYWQIEQPTKTNKRYMLKTRVSNLGRGLATDIRIRYAFNQPIRWYFYNYSEGLNGRLPATNVIGGVSQNELILIVPRMLSQDEVPATFVFDKPSVNVTLKIFSKEVSGQPYSQWQDKLNNTQKILSNISVFGKSLLYRLEMLRSKELSRWVI